ncbi:transcription factor bHLH146-like [Cicer arietinum]|uniref:Transcription factor bHLH146-like n=1 Tax=Cicer arietinum TaxID=3827 RepID=A0A1S2XE60_CICAR|nr:transcription factor bHLH146-like [Cicer arietinum]
MEGQKAKRRRVYSVEPNKVVQATFTRNYINYLAPTLMKIKEKSSIQDNNFCGDIQNVIKYEVDMAMVFSAQGYAWSNALKLKLQKGDSGEGSSKIYHQNEMGPLEKNCSKKEGNTKILVKNNLVEENNIDEDDEIVNRQLMCLRKLIPGGEEMCQEQMVNELESYVSCLQMQVNILKCLTHETS